jgi:type I restriction enzyme S subunit
MREAVVDTMEVRLWKRYTEFKETGHPAIGTIPQDWNVSRLKWLVSKIGSGKTPRGGGESYADSGVMFLRSQNVHFNGLYLDDLVYIDEETDKEMSSSRVNGDDVLLNITGASIGRCCVVPSEFGAANVNQHVCILRPRKELVHPAFLNAAISSSSVQSQIFTSENGVSREGLNFGQTSNLVFAFPARVKEQRAIAAFLRRETARIDALIGHKERLIVLLEEKRQAVISHAVTRGLDPNIRLEPCDMEWLSEKPQGWSVRKVKFLANNEPNSFTDGDWIESPYVTDQGIRLLQCGNVGTGNYIEQGFRYISSDTFEELRCTEVSPGDVLICRMRSSPRILAGRACVAPDLGVGMITAVDNCILKPAKGFESRFLVYQMSTMAYLQYVETIARGGTRDRISRSMLANIKLVLPAANEQIAIADHLDEVCSRLNNVCARVRIGIEQLQEYRIALISAAVTGQIDVREAG